MTEYFQIAAVIVIFLAMAVLMFLRKIPALLALPIMAVLIAFAGGVKIHDIIEFVLGKGSVKLYTAYTVAMFGSMLSVILQRTGVAESFIKKGAELSGDNPLVIGVIMLTLITLLFTTLGGLGAIIMVATIVLPIMSSVGIGPMTSVGIFLFGLSIGGTLNVGNWAVYVSVMGLTVDEIRPFALVMFAASFLGAIFFITIQLYRDGQDIKIARMISRSLILLTLILGIILINSFVLTEIQGEIVSDFLTSAGEFLTYLIGIGITLLIVLVVYRTLTKKYETAKDVHWSAYFSPIIPLFLILLFDIDFIAAFIVGLIYAFISTYKKGRLNLFVQCIFEGGSVVMPAVILMFGIGMLLVAIMGPGGELAGYPDGWPVLNLLKPIMAGIVPDNAFTYVLVFTIAAPLALYRGPLNVWGMGYGLAAVFLASGLNPGAVMGVLLAVGQIQGISDPTNTHNVWLANEMRVDVQKVLWNTIPYTWILAFIGLVISSILFM